MPGKNPRLKDEDFKKLLFKELNKGNLRANQKTNFYTLLATKYSIDKKRSNKLHDKYYPEWAKLSLKGIDEGIVQANKEQAENGVKSRTERILFYQNEIETMLKQLLGEISFTWMNGNRVMNSHTGGEFMLPVQVQNELRSQIKSYQSEISKLQGDYMPSKIAQTDSKGNDLKPVDLSKYLTIDQCMDILNAERE